MAGVDDTIERGPDGIADSAWSVAALNPEITR
jgi:ABC-type sugar transport system substrate-binding protein